MKWLPTFNITEKCRPWAHNITCKYILKFTSLWWLPLAMVIYNCQDTSLWLCCNYSSCNILSKHIFANFLYWLLLPKHVIYFLPIHLHIIGSHTQIWSWIPTVVFPSFPSSVWKYAPSDGISRQQSFPNFLPTQSTSACPCGYKLVDMEPFIWYPVMHALLCSLLWN